MWLVVKSLIRLESILSLQCFMRREHGEAGMISPAFSYLQVMDVETQLRVEICFTFS